MNSVDLVMGDKLKDIRHTTSDAVEIIRKLGSPEVQNSLEKISQTTQTAKEIIESLKDPEMVRNIDNMRLAVEAVQKTSIKVESMVLETKQTGVIDEAKEVLRSARNTISSVENKETLAEVTSAIKEMLLSIRALVDELKITVTSSKKIGVLHDAEQVVHEATSIYNTMRDEK
jgi:hypothetical protein